jgi:hypothetical protein
MAVADVSVYEAALKEGWTQDTLEKQFYSEDPLLDSIQKMEPTTSIGQEAITPVWTGRAGGYSVVPPTGSASLNAPDSQELNQAKWKYRRHWKQIKIDTGAVQQTSGSGNAVASVVDTEVEGALSDTRKQVTRQLFSDQTARIAKTTTTASSTTVKLSSTDMGYQAIRNGWLVPGQMIDIGTAGSEASVAADREITAVTESESEPKITISGAAVDRQRPLGGNLLREQRVRQPRLGIHHARGNQPLDRAGMEGHRRFRSRRDHVGADLQTPAQGPPEGDQGRLGLHLSGPA